MFAVGMFCLFFRAADSYIGWSSHEKIAGSMVHSDGSGYYAYLPEWFIYQQQGFEFAPIIEKKYPKERFVEDIGWNAKRKLGDKFYPGTAVVLSPFFLAGHLHAKIAEQPQDGYSWPYLFWLTIATAFYGAVGLLGLLLVGYKMGFSPFAVWTATLLIGVGTNYYFYSSGEIPMSHIFSFCGNAWAIYSLLNWKETNHPKWKILFLALVGLAVIVRPLNALILVLVPFLFDSFPLFRQRVVKAFRNELRSTLTGIAVFLLTIGIQVYNVWQQLGRFGLNLYTKEGFDNWQDPYFWHSLFGFEKGMFVYSPALLLFIPGIIVGWTYRRYLTAGILLFFVLTVYASSSWWCWGYGGAFGLRALIDFYGMYALAIMMLLSRLKTSGRVLVLIPIVITVYLYQVFDYQFRQGTIYFDQMNYNKFRSVFLKTDERFNYIFARRLDTLGGDFRVKGHINGMTHPLFHTPIKEFDFNNDLAWAQPFVTLRKIDFSGLQGNFGYRMQTEVWLGGTNSYVSMATKGYCKGAEVFAFDNPYSQLPGKVKEWDKISLDVNTRYPVSELDSVVCVFSAAATPSRIRKSVIYWGIAR